MYSSEIIERYRKVATASVADCVDQLVGKRGFMDSSIKPFINEKGIVGPAVTILEGPSDEELPPTHALDAIDEAESGSVIVISINGETNVAVWGGLMTAGAVANHHEGAVLDGGVRDRTEIKRDYDFPIYARSSSPGTTPGRYRTIEANTPVRVGGVLVHPGDLIKADIDGVVVVPRDYIEPVLIMAEEIDAKEAEQARLIIESGSLREGLAKYGRI